MKKKNYAVVLAVVMGVVCFMGSVQAAEEKAEEMEALSRIVTMKTGEGLTPATLTSKPGTTVIWVNHSSNPAEILFLDKKVTLACGSPVNFFVGKDGAYESAKIPFGGTASLCFTEKGKYEYVFKASATFYPMSAKEHRGLIWIK